MKLAKKLVLIVVVLMGISAVGLIGYNEYFGSGTKAPSYDAHGNLIEPEDDEGLKDRVSVLLIGADLRPDQKTYSTDTIILASIHPETKRTSLLSIPRDTRVALPGHGHVKITEVVLRSDLETLQKTVEELTGEEIKGYIQTDFQGFKQIIDTLGGISVDVEKNMYYETGDIQDGVIDLRKGEQVLDGNKALQYARFRNDALADISRTARQQIVMKAVAKEMFQLSTITKLPRLIPQLMKAVETNLSSKNILVLAKVAVGFDSENMVSQTLPGSFLDLDGISYWEVDLVKVKTVVSNLFQGKTTDRVIGDHSVDLLKPIIPTPSTPIPEVPGNSQDPNGVKSPGREGIDPENGDLPKVPGNSQDPNGQESPGHEEVSIQEFEIEVKNREEFSE